MSSFKWYYSSDAVRKELGSNPENLLMSGETVKANPVRKVVKNGPYFLKSDTRSKHNFFREFANGLAMKKNDIPAVEHLAHAIGSSGNILITREMPGAVEVESFLKNNKIDSKFLNGFSDVMKKVIFSDFIHNDFHSGNLLYAPESGQFALVDLHSIRKKFFWEKLYAPYCQCIPMFDLRLHLNKKELIDFFKQTGISNPEKLYYLGLKRTSEYQHKRWSKRCGQLFNAYMKFSRVENNWLISSDAPSDVMTLAAESSADAAALFAAGLYLKLNSIPHRQIFACDQKNSLVLREKQIQTTDVSREEADMMNERLKFAFLPPMPVEAWQKSDSGLPFIADLTGIAALPLIKKEVEKYAR